MIKNSHQGSFRVSSTGIKIDVSWCVLITTTYRFLRESVIVLQAGEQLQNPGQVKSIILVKCLFTFEKLTYIPSLLLSYVGFAFTPQFATGNLTMLRIYNNFC